MLTMARRIKEGSRKTVTTPSGFEFQIRKLSLKEIIQLFKGIPDSISLVERMARRDVTARDEAVQDPGKMEPFYEQMERTLALACTEPKVGVGEDEFLVSDLPVADAMKLFHEILELSEVAGKEVPQGPS